MNTGVKVLIGFIVAGAVGTGIYFAVRKKKGGVDSLGGGSGGDNEPYKDNTAMGVKDTIPSSVFPLKLGSQGRNVLLLQQALGNIDVDGAFGGQTATKAKLACFKNPLGTGIYGDCEVSQSDFNNIINKAGGLAKVQQAVMATKSAIWNRYS